MKRRTATILALVITACICSLAMAQEKSPDTKMAEEAACGIAACGGALLFIGLAFFVINILILIWVAKDASARGMDSVPLWVLLVFFTGLIGLIIYLVVRPKERIR